MTEIGCIGVHDWAITPKSSLVWLDYSGSKRGNALGVDCGSNMTMKWKQTIASPSPLVEATATGISNYFMDTATTKNIEPSMLVLMTKAKLPRSRVT